ncbi:hypothetical protein GCM10009576_028510 [Streptomyces rhizosphaericus]|uniref:Uncharacterized protein n=2 Tax=Streptomyces rhizosphaericus TaxID=114699 RepID=A0ABN1PCT4_9ACTN
MRASRSKPSRARQSAMNPSGAVGRAVVVGSLTDDLLAAVLAHPSHTARCATDFLVSLPYDGR